MCSDCRYLIHVNTERELSHNHDKGKGFYRSRRHDMTRSLSRTVLAAAAGFVVLFAGDNFSPTNPDSLISQAEARVGRPLTPMSGAGVARRTTRRAVYGTAAVGAAAVTRCYMTQNGQVCN
jgi:hypothetical protein